jgi:hypothetical protein
MMLLVAPNHIDAAFERAAQEAVPGIEGPDIVILQHLAGLATDSTMPTDHRRAESLPYRLGIHRAYNDQLVLSSDAAKRLKRGDDFRNLLYAWYEHPNDRDLSRKLREALVGNLATDLAMQCSIGHNLL